MTRDQINVKFKKLYPDTQLPKSMKIGDVGMDVYSREHRTLEQGEPYHFALGFATEFPNDHVGLLQDRSSMGRKGVRVLGGVIDPNYRGEWGVVLCNLTDKEVVIEKGDRIGQILFIPMALTTVEETTELSESERGDQAFGSSGK